MDANMVSKYNGTRSQNGITIVPIITLAQLFFGLMNY